MTAVQRLRSLAQTLERGSGRFTLDGNSRASVAADLRSMFAALAQPEAASNNAAPIRFYEMSEDDRSAFLDALENPPEPTEKLRKLLAQPEAARVGGEKLTYGYMPSYGRCDFRQLREAVSEATCGLRNLAHDPDADTYPGHVMVGQINYNSLSRIVSAFVDATLVAQLAAASEDGA